jgi:hypothetical protein
VGNIRFGPVFIAIILGTALVAGALLINSRRPSSEASLPTADLIRASGKCAECHLRETSAVVHQYATSRHAAQNINCLECHQPADGQDQYVHNGFTIARHLTAKNCARCHATEYDQFVRSRHAAPAWAAVTGPKDFSPEQIAAAEKYHKGAVDRPANALAILEGPSAIRTGCMNCHSVGRPNPDGSIGTCTSCHARHSASVALARLPETCGQCHMGPDHSQIEIYHESKHGVLFNAQKSRFQLDTPPRKLTTAHMSVPTCSTCHMSGLEGQKMTHDTTERLSWYLFDAVSEKRPHYERGQVEMKATCLKCHPKSSIERYYQEAEAVVQATNEKVLKAKKLMDGLYAEKLLTKAPFDEPIEFLYFDYWHYYGRTAKHGAFMGGADFVQWHGNYELTKIYNEMEQRSRELRKEKR